MTLPSQLRLSVRPFVLALVALGALAQVACPSPDARSEAIDPSALPQDVRADYDVFAQRCSKCHSLSRPLNSGIVDDDYWALYVARMRRQPGSGISLDDSRVILSFLHYYSLDQIRKKKAHEAAHDPDHSSPPAAPPTTTAPALDGGTGDAK
jgi:hypothetical protein